MLWWGRFFVYMFCRLLEKGVLSVFICLNVSLNNSLIFAETMKHTVKHRPRNMPSASMNLWQETTVSFLS